MTIEQFKWTQVSEDGTVHSMRIPGGTMYKLSEVAQRFDAERARWDWEVVACALCHVPDPPVMAELGTFAPPADDRPPMTDDALRAWLTATYGEPTVPGHPCALSIIRWTNGGRYIHLDTSLDRWWTEDSGWTAAHVAGPALHAAHRYGTP